MGIKHAKTAPADDGSAAVNAAEWNSDHVIDPNTIQAAQIQTVGSESKITFDTTAGHKHDGSLARQQPHADCGGLGNDDHTQYLNTTRHDVTARHTLGTVVPHDALAGLSEKNHSSLAGVTSDQHHAQLHEASHKSGGGDAFTSSDLLEAIIKRLQESGGPTTLLMGAVADGQYLRRSGTGLIGDSPAGLNHNLLSAVHLDTLVDSVVAGDIIIGNATPKWARLPKGTLNYVLKMGASLPAWAQVGHSELTGVSSDQHHAQLHEAAHKSGGGDAFLSTDVLEAIVKRLRESSGPTTLALGSVADGSYLRRSGSSIIGDTPVGTTYEIPGVYTIWKDGSTVKAQNGHTGAIDYSGADAATVINAALTQLTAGGLIFIKRGLYLINSVLVASYDWITICGEGRSTELRANASIASVLDCSACRLTKLSNVALNGYGLATLALNAGGIDRVPVYWLSDSYFLGATSSQVDLTGAEDSTLMRCFIDGRAVEGNAPVGNYGISVGVESAHGTGGQINIVETWIGFNKKADIYLKGVALTKLAQAVLVGNAYGVANYVANVILEGMTSPSIWCDLDAYGCWMEGATTTCPNILIQGVQASNINIDGGYYFATSGANIQSVLNPCCEYLTLKGGKWISTATYNVDVYVQYLASFMGAEWINSTNGVNRSKISGNLFEVTRDTGVLMLKGGILPTATSSYDIGSSGAKWNNLYVVTLHQGDTVFNDKICPKCGRDFEVGQQLVPYVVAKEDGGVRTVPSHVRCEPV